MASVRHVVNAGQNELLVDATWLEQWLTAEAKSLIWIEVIGKDAYGSLGGGGGHPGRLTRSRVRYWTPGVTAQDAAPGYYRIAATTDD